jgi:hypothetical protein
VYSADHPICLELGVSTVWEDSHYVSAEFLKAPTSKISNQYAREDAVFPYIPSERRSDKQTQQRSADQGAADIAVGM